jgi:hypothetical protein
MPVVIVPDSPMTLEVSALMLTKFSMTMEMPGVIAPMCPVTLQIFSLGLALTAVMTGILPTVIRRSTAIAELLTAPPEAFPAVATILATVPPIP